MSANALTWKENDNLFTNLRIGFHWAAGHGCNSISHRAVSVYSHANNPRQYNRLLTCYYLMKEYEKEKEKKNTHTEDKMHKFRYLDSILIKWPENAHIKLNGINQNETVSVFFFFFVLLTTVFSIFIINTVEASIAKFFGINTNWTSATGTSTFALIWQTFPF